MPFHPCTIQATVSSLSNHRTRSTLPTQPVGSTRYSPAIPSHPVLTLPSGPRNCNCFSRNVNCVTRHGVC
jgi:hypothetical protein